MSNAYGEGMSYDMPQIQQSSPPKDQSDKSPQSQLRTSTTGSFSRKNPPSKFSRGPGGQRQQWPLIDSSDQTSLQVPSSQRTRRAAAPETSQSRPVSNRAANPSASIPQYSGNAPRAPSSVYSGAGVWSDDGYNSLMFPSPNASRPVTGASIASTSSTYSLPDAPLRMQPQALPPIQLVPQQQNPIVQQPGAANRARAPLGPPPSSRRGPSYYYPQYPQQAWVSPIVEESDSQRNSERGSIRLGGESRGSYASSNAIPIGVPDYYLTNNAMGRNVDSYVSDYDEPELPSPPKINEVTRQDSPPALVRQASLGKRSKPTLTTIKSGDMVKPAPGHQRAYSDESSYDDNVQTLPPVPQNLATEESRPILGNGQKSSDSRGNISRRTDSSEPLGASEEAYLGRSSSESASSDFATYKMKDYNNEPVADRTARSPPVSNDPRVESILNRLEKGGALPQSENNGGLNQPTSFGQRIGTKRPPRINVDAVREAEQRGSLTSLPELIRRATKLASNLDRGKTASRLGFDWMLSGDEKQQEHKHRSGSLSDMISAFPPPAAAGTPASRATGRFAWPSHLRNDAMGGPNDGHLREGRPKKRICGMPVWVFLLVLLLLILLIAAAVIVPVVLIVIPHQSQNQAHSTVASCQQSLTCANGGVNIVGANGACRCLCEDSFTGATCSIPAGNNCTTMSVTGSKDATVGDSIPRLLDGSQSNFSIPLQAQEVLSLLTSSNITCVTQNSLVTFGVLSARSIQPSAEKLEVMNEPTATIQIRQASTVVSPASAATSDGIVFASGAPTPPSASGNSSSASTTQLDFARTAILFVLQDSGQYNDALAAQSSLKKAIVGGSSGLGNVTLQNGYSADLSSFRIVTKNGTVVGK